LTGFGIIASYLHRRVQLLKEREHFSFEYSGAKDPSRMVPALKLTEEEVLERLKKVLKEVTIVPHIVLEYCEDNPPPAVSCFICASIFSSLLVLSVFISLTCLLVVGYL
jgi:hypothetical protein